MMAAVSLVKKKRLQIATESWGEYKFEFEPILAPPERPTPSMCLPERMLGQSQKEDKLEPPFVCETGPDGNTESFTWRAPMLDENWRKE